MNDAISLQRNKARESVNEAASLATTVINYVRGTCRTEVFILSKHKSVLANVNRFVLRPEKGISSTLPRLLASPSPVFVSFLASTNPTGCTERRQS